MSTEHACLLRSAAIPHQFRHAFSTRLGGISEGKYASLNVSSFWGDDTANVAENRRRLLAAADLDGLPLASVKQVHGVAIAEAGEALERRRTGSPIEADGVVADTGSPLVCGVFSADCVPILFADASRGAVGAVHAGWRGTVAGIAAAAVATLVARGSRVADLCVALGPSICVGCFEVGDEVAHAFVARGLAEAIVRRAEWPRAHVDLRAANALLLRRADVAASRIDDAPPCTRCDPAVRFFSFRRDGAAGQQLSLIAPA